MPNHSGEEICSGVRNTPCFNCAAASSFEAPNCAATASAAAFGSVAIVVSARA